jgi:glycosyltransferase involved in cell wall biosynthesis
LKFNITYIIATRNRLPFLKITLKKLLGELQPEEEIVVVDGNSGDGTREYLEQLFKERKIHQFISEPDKNQAHAWNKAMLMAKGTIIKKIIDDDVFCYTAIRECKNYMLQNPDVDVMISNDLGSSLYNYNNIEKHSRLPQFNTWKSGLTPSLTFGDVHMLIRKSSLAYIGLYNTEFVMMDWEYSLRISHLKAKIAYYTGYNALSVAHPQTVTSLKNDKAIDEQGKRACVFYEYAGDAADISYWSKIKIFAGKLIYRQKQSSAKTASVLDENGLRLAYDHFYEYILSINQSGRFNFLKAN